MTFNHISLLDGWWEWNNKNSPNIYKYMLKIDGSKNKVLKVDPSSVF